ncbi:DNA gyrase inhibitor YacG [Bartonella sp. A05]|uniref:DNA gyrase inhibitor YacG n=1 Tax=Bartonella sp. A05 TaxID=2967261 RepID=UPI0022A92996|nr:DNA gyrase inhibitor YacG [Bartonella sp. A05]MCZ2203713.1 DNA gyrase inhibitor YacG [Bartonella sp. A05]
MKKLNQPKRMAEQQEKKLKRLEQSMQKSPARIPRPCPECGQMSQQNTYPFCSSRCRAIDLNRWLSGAYILPPPPQQTDEEE